MLTPFVVNPPSAVWTAAGRLRIRNTKVVISGASVARGQQSSLASTMNSVVLWASSSIYSARIISSP
jgi:hypothetical protein